MSPVVLPGSTFAGYRVEDVLGRGGMGVVYRAVQLGLERPVALKVIASDVGADASFRERFMRECQIAASLEHPNVLPVYEAGEVDGTLFLSMRYVASGDLGALLDGEPLPLQRALALVVQVADALDAAHERGLVHRDVKPSNVLVDRSGGFERAYLADFGLAKMSRSQSSLTHTGQLVGTLDYVAPEQIRGERVDARSDVYALTCLLYEMVTGKVPYAKDDDLAKLWAHMYEPVASPSALVPHLTPALDQVVQRGMAKEPENRYGRAGDLAQAALASVPSATAEAPTRSVHRLPRTARPRRSKLVFAALTATGVVLASTLALVFLLRGPQGAPTPAPRGPTSPETAPAPSGMRVNQVVDGDTILLGNGRRVRLLQIDAPQDGSECYGATATAALRGLLPPNAVVRLEVDPRLDRVDRLGRPLRYVFHDGLLVNLELVRKGAAAPWFADGKRGQYAARLVRAADLAKIRGRGLWGECPGTELRPSRRIRAGLPP
jgi:serine/threonine protein kinase